MTIHVLNIDIVNRSFLGRLSSLIPTRDSLDELIFPFLLVFHRPDIIDALSNRSGVCAS